MGLAASQARLLFITSRQNDVSAKMQRVSNDNMVLARDEDEVITKYNKMLNATTSVAKDGINITYDGLMGYGAAENNEINFVTVGANGIDGHPEYKNRVVLNSTIANALGLSGTGAGSEFPAASGCNSYTDLQQKLEPVLQAAAQADGLNPASKTEGSTDVKVAWKEKCKELQQRIGEYPATKKCISTREIAEQMGSVSAPSGYQTGRGVSTSDFNGVTFTQILNQQALTSLEIANDDDSSGVPGEQAKKNIQLIGNMFKEAILKALDMKANSTIDKELTAYINDLAAKAGNWNDQKDNELTSSGGGKLSEVASTYTFSSRGRSCGDAMTMDASKLLDRMLYITLANCSDNFNGWSSIEYAKTGQTDDYIITTNSQGLTKSDWESQVKKEFINGGFDSMDWSAALKIAKNLSSTSSIETTGASSVGKSTTGDYYKNLFDKLCSNGWYVDSDTSNLEEKIKNGTYYLNGTTADNNDDLFEEVVDEDTRNKAESYYNTEIKKIQRKEKLLDQELTKLQTEYSSLSTDYESVKSIISQNVSRSFTYCQNG